MTIFNILSVILISTAIGSLTVESEKRKNDITYKPTVPQGFQPIKIIFIIVAIIINYFNFEFITHWKWYFTVPLSLLTVFFFDLMLGLIFSEIGFKSNYSSESLLSLTGKKKKEYFKNFIVTGVIGILFFLLSFIGKNSDCTKIISSSATYEQAKKAVQSESFSLEDEADTSESSWISSAKYYSCDREKGFLIIGTDHEDYLYQNVPLSVWKEFKESPSLGSYYNDNIKGNGDYLVTLQD